MPWLHRSALALREWGGVERIPHLQRVFRWVVVPTRHASSPRGERRRWERSCGLRGHVNRHLQQRRLSRGNTLRWEDDPRGVGFLGDRS